MRDIHKRVLLIGLSLALGLTFLWLLSRNSLSISVRPETSILNVSALGKTLSAPLQINGNPISIEHFPQDRFSTPQILQLRHNWFQDSLVLLGCLITGRDCAHERLEIGATGVSELRLFNPFHTRLHFTHEHQQVDFFVNVAESTLEIWKETQKVGEVQVDPPRVLTTFAPTFASIGLALSVFFLFLSFAPLGSSQTKTNPVQIIPATGLDYLHLLLCFLLGAGLVWWIHGAIFSRLPGFGDEMNYLIQGRIFASGHFSVPEPDFELAKFFKVSWMDIFGTDGRIWDYHPIGNSLILALGWLLGNYWLTVPLIAGGVVAAQFLLAREILESKFWAGIYVLALCSSHYFLTLAASFMAHATCLLFITVYALAISRYLRNEQSRYLYLGAIAISLAFITRPVSAVLFGIVPSLVVLARSPVKKWTRFIAPTTVAIIIASSLFWYAYIISGHFTFPYLIKGPEMGQTLTARWQRGWDFRLKNLFRNWNELQTRIHSFGIMLNIFPLGFAISGAVMNRYRFAMAAGISTLVVYLFGHSFLHWYGWKWEPRMMYEVSFVVVLLGIIGAKTCCELFISKAWIYWPLVTIFVGSLLWAAIADLPRRLHSEYANYLAVKPELYRALEQNRVQNAIVFFDNEMDFAPYSIFNSPDFDGQNIFAISQGENSDYALISRHPGRKVYFSADGKSLVARHNFFEESFEQFSEELHRHGDSKVISVIPWAKYIEPAILSRFPGKVLDDNGLIQQLGHSLNSESWEGSILALVGASRSWGTLLKSAYNCQEIPTTGQTGAYQLYRIGKVNVADNATLPGFYMRCYSGRDWKPPIQKELLSLEVDANDCPGSDVSAQWDTHFYLKNGLELTLAVESDDGAGIWIDGVQVLDNGLQIEHGRLKKSVAVKLAAGEHRFNLKYFNGPSEGFVRVTVGINGVESPLRVSEELPLNFMLHRSDL